MNNSVPVEKKNDAIVKVRELDWKLNTLDLLQIKGIESSRLSADLNIISSDLGKLNTLESDYQFKTEIDTINRELEENKMLLLNFQKEPTSASEKLKKLELIKKQLSVHERKLEIYYRLVSKAKTDVKLLKHEFPILQVFLEEYSTHSKRVLSLEYEIGQQIKSILYLGKLGGELNNQAENIQKDAENLYSSIESDSEGIESQYQKLENEIEAFVSQVDVKMSPFFSQKKIQNLSDLETETQILVNDIERIVVSDLNDKKKVSLASSPDFNSLKKDLSEVNNLLSNVEKTQTPSKQQQFLENSKKFKFVAINNNQVNLKENEDEFINKFSFLHPKIETVPRVSISQMLNPQIFSALRDGVLIDSSFASEPVRMIFEDIKRNLDLKQRDFLNVMAAQKYVLENIPNSCGMNLISLIETQFKELERKQLKAEKRTSMFSEFLSIALEHFAELQKDCSSFEKEIKIRCGNK